MTTNIDLIDGSTGQLLTLGWMDDIVDFNFPAGNILALLMNVGYVTPSGVPIFALNGTPFPIPNAFVNLANIHAGNTTRPPITDPQTTEMINSYDVWTVPHQLQNTVHSNGTALIIPAKRLQQGKKTAFTLTMSIPGFGNQFIIDHIQTVYVPWDANVNRPFPGGDTDEFGNVFPIRPLGLNANHNGTLRLGNSPPLGTIFLQESGWGCYTTQAASDQQCNALNSFLGSSVHYTTFPWDFWFTSFCGSSGTITAATFKGKAIKHRTFNDWFNGSDRIGQASISYLTGHAQRVSSWGFINTGTAHLGQTGVITIKGDAKTLTLSGSHTP
jgi:hypothetical protein